ATWTCAASVGSSCATASGTGDINTTVNVAAGGSVVIEITATLVDPNASTVVNSASVQPAAGVIDTNPGNNVSTLDLRVALFSDGFESAGTPGGSFEASTSVQTIEIGRERIAAAASGLSAKQVARYSIDGLWVIVEAREVNGVLQIRLLQQARDGLWTNTRWLDVLPGERARIDYLRVGQNVEVRLSIGQ
ncbi:MAG: hypothetical protein ACK5PG_16980, partial [Lysobacterales bacterium]